ncbi:tyrosine-type recombinase/integrase [Glycomyces sp. MUSA5-2]|uniref:tyrosine-type recombinase/integrase n=1 Tax=Glycomyces sp. MUSA5-2 TaxID=2053002 RepID=UPI00300998C2
MVIFKTRIVKRATRRPHNVRWRTGKGTKPHSEYYATPGQAKGQVAMLEFWRGKGVEFDMETGLPLPVLEERKAKEQAQAELEARTARMSVYEHLEEFAQYKWGKRSGNYHTAISDYARDIMVALLPPRPDWITPKALNLALRNWAFNPSKNLDDADDLTIDILGWVEESSPPIDILSDLDVLSALLDEMTMKYEDRSYTVRIRASPKTFEKRKTLLLGALNYAVIKDRLDANPLHHPKLDWERPTGFRVVDELDEREVGDIEQAESMFAAVSYVWPTGLRYVAAFACEYYSVMRPEEVANLRDYQCIFPPDEAGPDAWGDLDLDGALTYVGKDWTDDGQAHEARPLKGRAIGQVRHGIMPPPLVRYLKWHIATFGVQPDGRLFATPSGGPIVPGTMWLLWTLARAYGLGPVEQKRKVLKSPYMLRKSGICLLLYLGVPPAEVAEIAGHTVEMLHRVYDKVIRKLQNKWRERVGRFFKTRDLG